MKNILSYQVGHDSSIVGLSKGKLIASIEGEKDSNSRFYKTPSLDDAIQWFVRLNKIEKFIPDVIAISGWAPIDQNDPSKISVYNGLDHKEIISKSIYGRDIDFFYSTHEKAHIFLSYAMSPFSQAQPVYCLTWEGSIGTYYKIDSNLTKITKIKDVIPYLGEKYSFLFVLAGATTYIDLDSAGKIMALTSFAVVRDVKKYKDAIDYLLLFINSIGYSSAAALALKEHLFEKFGFIVPYNKGIDSQEFAEFAWAMQERVLEIFLELARAGERLPLIISGGCGLNCYWNQRIKESGVFEDVFVPPCPNDSGIAIGLAAEAQFHYTGNAKIEWNVYAGEFFNENEVDINGFTEKTLDYREIAEQLNNGDVIAWIQDRYEIGPRALCNRSLLANPFSNTTRDRLNFIKKREQYRPIAPVCLEEDALDLFNVKQSSPYMLYFSEVTSSELKAVTHVDNTARVQTVSESQNKHIYNLLKYFKRVTGYGVLCNTSLNYNGKGFINNSRDAFKYARERGLDGIVIGEKFYKNNSTKNVMPIGLSILPHYNNESDSLCLGIDKNEMNTSPSLCPLLGSLEITDWSLYNTLEFDLTFISECDPGKRSRITLYADDPRKEVRFYRITNTVSFGTGTTSICFRLIEDPTKKLLQNVSGIRISIKVENASNATLGIANVQFLRAIE